MPAVAYSGGQESLPGMGGDQFLVSYVYDSGIERLLEVQALKGAYDASTTDQREGGPVSLYRTFASINFGLSNPDVVGSVNNGNYLVVWESMSGGFAGNDYDVRGRMLTPYAIFMPLVVRG